MLLHWRYIYARPLIKLEDAERLRQLVETHGEDSRAVGNHIRSSFKWVPYWRRRRAL